MIIVPNKIYPYCYFSQTCSGISTITKIEPVSIIPGISMIKISTSVVIPISFSTSVYLYLEMIVTGFYCLFLSLIHFIKYLCICSASRSISSSTSRFTHDWLLYLPWPCELLLSLSLILSHVTSNITKFIFHFHKLLIESIMGLIKVLLPKFIYGES